ncbi:hypothetical protein BCR44DRAFT_1439200, partial [Catenaria anguillulae PL171]
MAVWVIGLCSARPSPSRPRTLMLHTTDTSSLSRLCLARIPEGFATRFGLLLHLIASRSKSGKASWRRCR